jgi:ABC-type bacteriocin/lantibiotic exporter with double-glycine peptidase domain
VFELLALAAILWVVAGMPRESISTGVFISFIAAYGAYMGASLQLARGAVAVWNAKPSWTRLAPLLKAVPEGAGLRRDPGGLTGAIDLTGVYFRYGVEAPFALQGLSLSIAPGEFVALVGPSGAGKSTVMRLLLGFEMPISGTVQYDHQDLRFLDLELFRRQIGVVLQNSALFPGTLYENIMGTVDGTMDDAWEAARNAGIEDDIKSMPMGMHTVVTEASSAFSGGQIQRIAIARALVGKPRILLFDEATSAVDNVTQAAITASLERLAVTRLVVAHRLSTVKKAHRIVVLNHGKVEQAGRYEDLVKAPGLFAEIARRQLI